MRSIALVLVSLALAACASAPVSPEAAEAIPASQIMSGQTVATTQYSAELTIVRDSGGTVFGLAKPIEVMVDGKLASTLDRPATKFSVFVEPGLHTVQVGRSMMNTMEFSAGTQVTTQAGTNLILHTGESPSASEPLRIFVGDAVPI
jgi:hypothetical protein